MSAHSDHEAFLRAALHAAADSLEPRSDGLERIRARLLRPRPAFVTRAQVIGSQLLLRTPAWLQDVLYQTAGILEDAWKRLAPPPAPGRHRSRAQGWLRPIAAMAIVMFVVAAVTYVAIGASTTFSPSSANSHSSGISRTGHHSHGPRPAASAGGGTSLGGSHSSPAATPSCTSTSSAKKTSSPSPAASQSQTSNPTPSDSTDGSGSSPSPSDSTPSSPDPGDSTSPSVAASTTPAAGHHGSGSNAAGTSPGPCPSR